MLKIGDAVVYLADPLLFGQGIYVESTKDGWMIVEFSDGTRHPFRSHELDAPDRAYLSSTS